MMASPGLSTTTVQDAIAEMVRRIVSQFNPDKIILFGSHARGQAGPDSDVDLLVVMPVEGSRRRKATEIDGTLADRTIPLDLIVVTPEEFEQARDQIGSVLRPAALEGLVLYDRAA
ncbi:MAG: nucleotidyltransferase domain-containing protein [Nitrospira sp.]|nr:nucleotidyltransferase domain-containing protein [Nitrospira sp.]